MQSEHDEENRLLNMGDSDYDYDDNGNQLGVDSAGDSHYLSTYINGEKWNLRTTVLPDDMAGIPWTSYSYALDGRRVGKEIAWFENKPSTWENVHYLYDGQNVVYEFGSNHPTVRYTHPLAGYGQSSCAGGSCTGGVCGPTADTFVDAPISVTVDGVKYYYLYDGLGSVTELIDEDENVVNRYRYTPFGESLLKIEGVFNPYQFTGRRYDQETGQYYYRTRMYSPSQGRFLSNDPLGMVDGPNMYSYVRGDPVNHRDPSGKLLIGAFEPVSGIFEIFPVHKLPHHSGISHCAQQAKDKCRCNDEHVRDNYGGCGYSDYIHPLSTLQEGGGGAYHRGCYHKEYCECVNEYYDSLNEVGGRGPFIPGQVFILMV